jgi:biopolymer transport protein ExbB/TolQ
MNPLQNLKDIRTPASIEIWPPAYGWWLLACLLLIGICILTIWLVKLRKVRLAKRQALKALQQIDGSHLDSIPQLNQLLKRLAMTYFPNQNVQQMHGAQWTKFLVHTLPSKKAEDVSETFELMQQALYQPHTSENPEFSSYSKSVETWIKYALPPKQHVFPQLEQNNA